MAGTTISANFYKMILTHLKKQIQDKLETECREFAEKVIAEEIAKFTFSVEDLVSIEAGGHEMVIRIQRENK
jgi:predicted house-cleaning noncanonical NTP pyrophosphatase (MazG superfamily)